MKELRYIQSWFYNENWIKQIKGHKTWDINDCFALNLIYIFESKFIIEVLLTDNCYNVISGNNMAEVYLYLYLYLYYCSYVTTRCSDICSNSLRSPTLFFLRNESSLAIPVIQGGYFTAEQG